MKKRDLKKELGDLYRPPSREVVEVDVPELRFLMIDGRGDPNSSDGYAQAVEALFGLSYALKFAVKKGPLAIDYGVMPLEGLWWSEDMSSFETGDRSDWEWTMMIGQPDVVDEELFAKVAQGVRDKKDLAALPLARLESFEEGLAAQVMHLGPFAEEGPTIERVHDFIEETGRQRHGKHHEVYLSDIRRAAPANWKTIIRQPMR